MNLRSTTRFRPRARVRPRFWESERHATWTHPLELPGLPRPKAVHGRPPVPPRPEPEPAARSAPRPRIIVTGDSSRADTVERLLAAIPLDTRRETTTLETLKELRPATRAVVLVSPLPILDPETAVEVLAAHDRAWSAPILTVLPDREADGEPGQRLRLAGADAVVAWPRDALRLGPLVLEALRSEPGGA